MPIFIVYKKKILTSQVKIYAKNRHQATQLVTAGEGEVLEVVETNPVIHPYSTVEMVEEEEYRPKTEEKNKFQKTLCPRKPKMKPVYIDLGVM